MNKKTKYTIALYETEYGCLIVDEVRAKPCEKWIQLSEPIEVEFKPLAIETVLNEKVKVIDALIEKEKTEAMKRIQELTEKRQELLALTQQ